MDSDRRVSWTRTRTSNVRVEKLNGMTYLDESADGAEGHKLQVFEVDGLILDVVLRNGYESSGTYAA